MGPRTNNLIYIRLIHPLVINELQNLVATHFRTQMIRNPFLLKHSASLLLTIKHF